MDWCSLQLHVSVRESESSDRKFNKSSGHIKYVLLYLSSSKSWISASQFAANFSRAVVFICGHAYSLLSKVIASCSWSRWCSAVCSEKRLLYNKLWARVLLALWDHWNSIRYSAVSSCKRFFEHRICTHSPPMFLSWYNSKVFAAPLTRRCKLYLWTQVWVADECETTWSLDVRTSPLFGYNSLLLIKNSKNDFLWNLSIVENCALTVCSFFDSCGLGSRASFSKNPRKRSARDHVLVVIYVLPSRVRGFVSQNEICCLLVCTIVEALIGCLAVNQSLTVD